MLFIMKVYGYILPWNVHKLQSPDKKVLNMFFTENLSLIERSMSTNEISNRLREGGKRTRNRLNKLEEFGFLESEEIKKGQRSDNYWSITEEGILYVMTTLRRKRLNDFIRENSDVRILYPFEVFRSRNKGYEIDLILEEIKNHILEFKYKKISDLIVDLHKRKILPLRVGRSLRINKR